jgi:hypothetical protein
MKKSEKTSQLSKICFAYFEFNIKSLMANFNDLVDDISKLYKMGQLSFYIPKASFWDVKMRFAVKS